MTASVTGWKVKITVVHGNTDVEDILCQKCLKIVNQEIGSSRFC